MSLELAAEICKNCPPKKCPWRGSLQTQPLRLLYRIFSVSSQASPPQPGEELFAVISWLQTPTNSSHTSLESLQGSSAGLSLISTGYPQLFKGEMHYLQLQLCLRKNCPFRAFSKCYWSKIEENMGEKSPKSQCKKTAEQRRKTKRNQLSGCLETAWVLLEDLFFPLFWVVFTSPTSKSRNSLGWELHNPRCGGWN